MSNVTATPKITAGAQSKKPIISITEEVDLNVENLNATAPPKQTTVGIIEEEERKDDLEFPLINIEESDI